MTAEPGPLDRHMEMPAKEHSAADEHALTSIAISLKRIADEFVRRNDLELLRQLDVKPETDEVI